MAFEDNAAHPQPTSVEQFLSGAAQSEPLWKYGTLLIALLCLVFFVIRPVMRKSIATANPMTAALPEEQQLTPGAEPSLPFQVDEEAVEHKKKRAQLVFDSVSEHLRREPAQTTRLLQSWIHTE
jgi:flagellar M-ring protein FliF